VQDWENLKAAICNLIHFLHGTWRVLTLSINLNMWLKIGWTTSSVLSGLKETENIAVKFIILSRKIFFSLKSVKNANCKHLHRSSRRSLVLCCKSAIKYIATI
jgi:hypothetical protein